MSDGRFAGVDWASEEHAVCVVDERGRILEGRRYRHSEPGIRALCARLVRLRVALAALERNVERRRQLDQLLPRKTPPQPSVASQARPQAPADHHRSPDVTVSTRTSYQKVTYTYLTQDPGLDVITHGDIEA
jgi:hypothetical protein